MLFALYVSSSLNLGKWISLTIISHNCLILIILQESCYEIVTCNTILNLTNFVPLLAFTDTPQQNHTGTTSTVDGIVENKAPENCSGVFTQLLFAYYSRPYI